MTFEPIHLPAVIGECARCGATIDLVTGARFTCADRRRERPLCARCAHEHAVHSRVERGASA